MPDDLLRVIRPTIFLNNVGVTVDLVLGEMPEAYYA